MTTGLKYAVNSLEFIFLTILLIIFFSQLSTFSFLSALINFNGLSSILSSLGSFYVIDNAHFLY